MKKVIEIEGVKVGLVFTFYTYKLLGDLWEKKSVQEVMNHIVQATSGVGTENLSFEAMNVFSDIVSVLDEADLLTEKQIQDYLFSEPENIALLVQAFTDSLVSEKPNDSKKKKTENH